MRFQSLSRRFAFTLALILLGVGLAAAESPAKAFQCYVPECDLLRVFMDIHGRTALDIEVKLTARERDSGKEATRSRIVNLDLDRTWKMSPTSAQDLDRIRWYVRELGQEWSAVPAMECRCSYFGGSIEVYVGGVKVDEYENPNAP